MTAQVQRTAIRTFTFDDMCLSLFFLSLSDELKAHSLAIKWIGNAGSHVAFQPIQFGRKIVSVHDLDPLPFLELQQVQILGHDVLGAALHGCRKNHVVVGIINDHSMYPNQSGYDDTNRGQVFQKLNNFVVGKTKGIFEVCCW